MKILMYSTHEHERTYAEEWAKETGNQVTMEMVPLTKETVAMAKGYDGVSVQQTSRIDEEVYRALHELGIKQISTRTAGVDMFDLQAAAQNGITITNVAIYSPRAIGGTPTPCTCSETLDASTSGWTTTTTSAGRVI